MGNAYSPSSYRSLGREARKRPRLLWIVHNSWESLEGQRPCELIRRLVDRYEIHVISWSQPKGVDLTKLGAWRSFLDRKCEKLHIHHAFLLPNVYRAFVKGYPPQVMLYANQLLFRRYIRRVIRGATFDVGVVSSSHHFTGYPPWEMKFPVIFDYLDLSPKSVEQKYCRHSSVVIAASPAMAARVAGCGRPTFVVPNGVDVARLRTATPEMVRSSLEIGSSKVVSLIGLTMSASLYFVDAVASVARSRDVVLLAVGDGPGRFAIEERCRQVGLRCLAPGWVSPDRVVEYFAVTDIGLYPGDDSEYFRAAMPLKILGYLAAGKPVVSSPVDACAALGLRGVRIAPATVIGFATALAELLDQPVQGPISLDDEFDWSRIAAQLASIVDDAIAGRLV